MITTANVQICRAEIISITCDKCGNTSTPKDTVEFQEAYHISFIGGWGSVFGDEEEITVDFCQRCLKELIGPYYKVTQ